MKYILYTSESEWDTSNSNMETHFSIPDGRGCERYAKIEQVGNKENDDYGKYIFPVCNDGSYICTDQFPSDELVDFNPLWNIPPVPPG